MKNLLFFTGIVFCSSFSTQQVGDFFGDWNVTDSYNIENINFKEVSMHDLVKKRIVDQKSQIIFSKDHIMIKQNESITDQSKVIQLKEITKDSIVFKFDDHTASFKLKSKKTGILTVDKKAVFELEKK